MLTDGRDVDGVLDTDLCVVGAGPAGITLARELESAPFDVLVLESGGRGITPAADDLMQGDVLGRPYGLEKTRARRFGGASALWLPYVGLRARPLDAVDFQRRPGHAWSGWPLDRAELDPYYARAQVHCRLGPYAYDAQDYARGEQVVLQGGDVRSLMFQHGPLDGFLRHLPELEQARGVQILLHANAVELELDAGGRALSAVQVATLEGNRFRVRAGAYVLAAGGLENPRLLLASNRQQPAGVGNQHDWVGRGFMEHPHVHSGFFRPQDRTLAERLSLYQRHQGPGEVQLQAALAVSQDALRREQLLNASLWLRHTSMRGAVERVRCATRTLARHALHPQRPLRRLGRDLHSLADVPLQRFLHRRPRNNLLAIYMEVEQAPQRGSRVTLGSARDALGLPRLQLDWRVSDVCWRSVRRTQEVVDAELRRQGLGRLEELFGEEIPSPPVQVGCHHLGTTRMSADPAQGVVDADCRVHGLDNLYLAGSSVFPTGGFANPTLSISALAVRLADHLRQRLR